MAITINNSAVCDLSTGLVPEARRVFLATNDSLANQFDVEILNNGAAATVTGSVKGFFLRPDGVTVIIAGTLTGNKASVTLPTSCYFCSGHFMLTIQVGDTSVRIVEGSVVKTSSDSLIDESGVYSLAELVTLINSKLEAPEVDGTAGQVLTADGAGGVLWDDANVRNVAGKLKVGSTTYTVRTGTAGASGYLTFVTE